MRFPSSYLVWEYSVYQLKMIFQNSANQCVWLQIYWFSLVVLYIYIYIYIYIYHTMIGVFTAALLPTKPWSDDDSGFRHILGAEASLPLTQSVTAITHDTTRLYWIDVTLWDFHIHTDAVRVLSWISYVFPLACFLCPTAVAIRLISTGWRISFETIFLLFIVDSLDYEDCGWRPSPALPFATVPIIFFILRAHFAFSTAIFAFYFRQVITEGWALFTSES